ncbi:hypothetical protein DFJ77DRAFT_449749 [Powellomyces hirtus]|nr:hypothetical protein DFJ77DRAFT_449749 [Powellomyces hirtus]
MALLVPTLDMDLYDEEDEDDTSNNTNPHHDISGYHNTSLAPAHSPPASEVQNTAKRRRLVRSCSKDEVQIKEPEVDENAPTAVPVEAESVENTAVPPTRLQGFFTKADRPPPPQPSSQPGHKSSAKNRLPTHTPWPGALNCHSGHDILAAQTSTVVEKPCFPRRQTPTPRDPLRNVNFIPRRQSCAQALAPSPAPFHSFPGPSVGKVVITSRSLISFLESLYGHEILRSTGCLPLFTSVTSRVNSKDLAVKTEPPRTDANAAASKTACFDKNALRSLKTWLDEWKTVRISAKKTEPGTEPSMNSTPQSSRKSKKTGRRRGGGLRNSDSSCSTDDDHEYACSNSDGENDALRMRYPKHMMLVGPPGNGKTSLVYSLANENGFDVIEVNAGQRRSGKDVATALGEAIDSHNIEQLGISSVNFETLFRRMAAEHVKTIESSQSLSSSRSSSKSRPSAATGEPPKKKGRKSAKAKRLEEEAALKAARRSNFFTPAAQQNKVEEEVDEPIDVMGDPDPLPPMPGIKEDPSLLPPTLWTEKHADPQPPTWTEANPNPLPATPGADENPDPLPPTPWTDENPNPLPPTPGVDAIPAPLPPSPVADENPSHSPPAPGPETDPITVLDVPNPDTGSHASDQPGSEGRNSVPEEPAPLRRRLILIEDADFLCEADKGFWTTVCSLLQKSKCPIAFTCNTSPLCTVNPGMPDAVLTPLLERITTIEVQPPSSDELACFLHLALLSRSLWPRDVSAMAFIADLSRGDVRQCLNQLTFRANKAAGQQTVSLSFPSHADDRSQAEIPHTFTVADIAPFHLTYAADLPGLSTYLASTANGESLKGTHKLTSRSATSREALLDALQTLAKQCENRVVADVICNSRPLRACHQEACEPEVPKAKANDDAPVHVDTIYGAYPVLPPRPLAYAKSCGVRALTTLKYAKLLRSDDKVGGLMHNVLDEDAVARCQPLSMLRSLASTCEPWRTRALALDVAPWLAIICRLDLAATIHEQQQQQQQQQKLDTLFSRSTTSDRESPRPLHYPRRSRRNAPCAAPPPIVRWCEYTIPDDVACGLVAYMQKPSLSADELIATFTTPARPPLADRIRQCANALVVSELS